MKIGVFVDYKINQDFIANVLCINKDKPEPTCNGKCYLNTQLEKTENKQSKDLPNVLLEIQEISLYYQYYSSSLWIKQDDKLLISSIHPDIELPKSKYVFEIFHPPQSDLI